MTVVAFVPQYRPVLYPKTEPARIIILPVVRVERNPDTQHDLRVDDFARRTGRRRRRSKVDDQGILD